MQPDPYQVLGVTNEATSEEIHRAYRSEAKRWHPDVNSDPEATQRFRDVQEAYDVLADPAARAAYDWRSGQAPEPEPAPYPAGPSPWAMMADLLAALFDDPYPTPTRRAAMGDTEVVVDDATGSIYIRRNRPTGTRIRVNWKQS